MKIFLTIILLLLSTFANALTLEKPLENPFNEKQAQEVFQQIRCMVCNGQSIADSRAELAEDLRAIIRSKIAEGYSNKQVVEYLVSRYGEAVLMRPPLQFSTYLLWFGPVIILFAGIGSLCYRIFAKR